MAKYLPNQFSGFPQELVDILVWGFKKPYIEDNITYTFCQPVNSKCPMLYYCNDSDLIVYTFLHRTAGVSAVHSRTIHKCLFNMPELMDAYQTLFGVIPDDIPALLSFISRFTFLGSAVSDGKFNRTEKISKKIIDIACEKTDGIIRINKISNRLCQKIQKHNPVIKQNSQVEWNNYDSVSGCLSKPHIIKALINDGEDYSYGGKRFTKLVMNKKDIRCYYKEIDDGYNIHVFIYDNRIIKTYRIHMKQHFVDRIKERIFGGKEIELSRIISWLRYHNGFDIEVEKQQPRQKYTFNNITFVINDGKKGVRTFYTIWAKSYKKF